MIVTLWVLSLLTIFAISLGFNSRAQLYYTRHFRDRLKAHYLARAGIEKAISVLLDEDSNAYESLNEPWANSEELFKEIALEGGFATVSYCLDEYNLGKGSGEKTVLFGAMDESSRIDINSVSVNTITNLLERVADIESNQAGDIASAIIDWRDEDNAVSLGGAENEYYENLETPYTCKNGNFQVSQELLLVRGMSQEIFSKINEIITVYGTEKVNINTAGFRVLYALGLSEKLCERIIEYRRGRDGVTGTEDDNIFKSPGDLNNIGSLFTEESTQISYLISSNMLTVRSDVFRICSEGSLESGTGKHTGGIVCVVKRLQDKRAQILYWNER
jgi:general secretion pathway protein K